LLQIVAIPQSRRSGRRHDIWELRGTLASLLLRRISADLPQHPQQIASEVVE
jgi:hypothetical protein